MSIPKIIHYCWFSGEKKPEKIQACIDTWKKYLPDYKIIEWNTTNFNINCNEFVKEAYVHKKWAFVADYFRAWVLYNYGGIYLDADVEIKQTFNKYLDCKMFISFEDNELLGPHVIGSEINNEYMLDIIKLMDKRKFVREDGSFDMTILPELATAVAVNRYGLVLNGKTQCFSRCLFYSCGFFTIDLFDGKCVAEHKYAGSWLENDIDYYNELRNILIDNSKWWKFSNIRKNIRRVFFSFVPKRNNQLLILYPDQNKKVNMEVLASFEQSIPSYYKVIFIENSNQIRKKLLDHVRFLWILARSNKIVEISDSTVCRYLSPFQNYVVISDFSCLEQVNI